MIFPYYVIEELHCNGFVQTHAHGCKYLAVAIKKANQIKAQSNERHQYKAIICSPLSLGEMNEMLAIECTVQACSDENECEVPV